ncbi:MAG: Competence protein ComEC [Parcubacteria group bacterium]|nr:Competence protein ComEC [Parcubacteria group bacterium]
MPGYGLSAALGFTVGVGLGTFSALSWPTLLFFGLLSLLILGSGVWPVRRNTCIAVGIFLLMVVLGVCRFMESEQRKVASVMIVPRFGVSQEGKIVADPDIRESSQRVTVEIEIEGKKTRILAVTPLYPQLSFGQRVLVSGTPELPKPFETDGGRTFRYDKFLEKDGIFAIVQKANVKVLGPPEGLFAQLLSYLYLGKHIFTDALGAALPEPESSLAVGILTGGKQGLGKELLEAFTIAGLLPVVVLSGYNVMIVVEAVLRIFSFLPKRISIVVAAITITLFVLVAGAGSSAVRAGFMAGLGLLARFTDRTYDVLRALIIVLVVMLIINPLYLVYDPGFQFSFAATLGLVLGSPLVLERLSWIKGRFLREILASTIAAQVFVLPLLLYQTGNLSLVSLPANVLVLPVVPLAMLFSAIAGVCTLVFPALGPLIAFPAYTLLWFVIAVAENIARLPFADVVIPIFPFWVVGLSYVVLFWIGKRIKKNQWDDPLVQTSNKD